MYQTVFFDMDGTLVDTFEGIYNSVVYALHKFGIQVQDKAQVKPFVGPPLYQSFEKYFGFSRADALKAVDCYREYYKEKGVFECYVYDGIIDVLSGLKALGKQVVLATGKPEVFAERILKRYRLEQYFDYAAGATLTSERVEKADVVAYALNLAGISDPKTVVMVGDRENDVLGALKNNMDCIGVLFGYGSEAELKGAGARYIAAAPKDILKFI